MTIQAVQVVVQTLSEKWKESQVRVWGCHKGVRDVLKNSEQAVHELEKVDSVIWCSVAQAQGGQGKQMCEHTEDRESKHGYA